MLNTCHHHLRKVNCISIAAKSSPESSVRRQAVDLRGSWSLKCWASGQRMLRKMIYDLTNEHTHTPEDGMRSGIWSNALARHSSVGLCKTAEANGRPFLVRRSTRTLGGQRAEGPQGGWRTTDGTHNYGCLGCFTVVGPVVICVYFVANVSDTLLSVKLSIKCIKFKLCKTLVL